MQPYFISGIQQIGLGNSSVYDTWEWYRKHLNMDIPIFDEAAEAKLMLPYTGNEVRSRHAVLAMNFGGGAGLEIWQYTSRKPTAANFDLQFSDLGILCAKFKTPDIAKVYQYFVDQKLDICCEPTSAPFGISHFFAKDPFGNLIEITEGLDYYDLGKAANGGIVGATLGVQDIDQILPIMQELLGYDIVVGDSIGASSDTAKLGDPITTYRRVLLTHGEPRKGPFSKLLGKTYIELVCAQNKTGRRIFENRYWGDLGYIHLCFDVVGMDAIKSKAEKLGYPFTVDSQNSFDMGEAAGRFSYIETKEGILLEFVETHKIPILKKLGWYLNLKTRNREKPLPRLLLKALSLNRVKKAVN